MKPMLAALYDPAKAVFPAIVDPKVDGIRAMLRCEAGRILSAVSREGEALPALALAASPLAKAVASCWVDVEVRADTGFAATLDAARLGAAPVTVYVLDIVYDARRDAPLSARAADVDAAVALCRSPRIVALPRRTAACDADVQAAYAEWTAAGYEGAMVKDPAAPYREGRSCAWMKLKPCLDMECTIAGATEGTGKHAGMLGTLIVVTPDGAVCAVPPGKGVTTADRREIWERRKALIGQLAEVQYQEVLPSGQLRHGRFLRLRLDRSTTKPAAPPVITGHPLAAWRTHRGMSQRALAEASGVQASYIAAIESGKKPGSIQAWFRLAVALGTPIESLLPADILAAE